MEFQSPEEREKCPGKMEIETFALIERVKG
jgi:hypothetical protein